MAYTVTLPMAEHISSGMMYQCFKKFVVNKEKTEITYYFSTRAKQIQFICEYANWFFLVKIKSGNTIFLRYS